MVIFGTQPLDNENASIMFGAVVCFAEKKIEEWFASSDEPEEEPGLVGYIVALRGLLQINPAHARICLSHDAAVRWKRSYEQWLDRYEKSIKVKRGVDRQKLREAVLREFDLLIEALS